MNILAVYGSNYGQAEKVLRRVAAGLEGQGHALSVYKGDALPASLALADFDGVVVAASIVVGQYQKYIRDFVTGHLAELNAIPSAFVSVNGGAPETDPGWRAEAEGYVQDFLAQTGWAPRWTATFAGALRYREYNFFIRWIIKRISRQHGGPTDTSRDYEFTDWDAVDRFARMLGEAMAAAPESRHAPPNG